MCQCIIADCWWCNACGVPCGGISQELIYCGCWICKQPTLEAIKPDCCICGECVGWGGNTLCWGGICCAPDWVKNYSKKV